MGAQTSMPSNPDWQFDDGGEYEDYAERFGTPYYLYDTDLLLRRANEVRNAFRGTASVYFAVKANPNLTLLETIRDGVDGLDISSVGELEQALLAGYDAEDLSFAGPAKSPDELGRAIECGVGSISVESERELRDITKIASDTGRKANVTLRVNPQTDPRAFGLKMGGRPLQFGIDEEQVESVVRTVADRADVISFRGVHVYAGSQGFESDSLANSYRNTLEIAARIEAIHGAGLEKVNLGGGFGVSHSSAEKVLDLAALADSVSGQFEEFVARRDGRCRLIFELGRYLVADAGVYVTRVIGTKESRGQFFAVTDGGLHHHLAAAGNFGVGFRSNYPVVNISRPDAPKIKCSIAGPSCNPTDLLGQNTEIGKPREGDLIAVLSSGSYGLTASPILFLGRKTPAEIIRSGGSVTLGRGRREITDFN